MQYLRARALQYVCIESGAIPTYGPTVRRFANRGHDASSETFACRKVHALLTHCMRWCLQPSSPSSVSYPNVTGTPTTPPTPAAVWYAFPQAR